LSRIRIFVSYSHEDYRWVDAESDCNLIPWLARSLRREAEFWYDPELRKSAGAPFLPIIQEEIGSARIAVLLLSQNFASSEFIEQYELPLIRQRLEAGVLAVIPILVGPVDLQAETHLRWLTDRQIIPGKPTPLIRYTGNRAEFEDARVEILKAIRERVKQLLGPALPDESADLVPPPEPGRFEMPGGRPGAKALPLRPFLWGAAAVVLCLAALWAYRTLKGPTVGEPAGAPNQPAAAPGNPPQASEPAPASDQPPATRPTAAPAGGQSQPGPARDASPGAAPGPPPGGPSAVQLMPAAPATERAAQPAPAADPGALAALKLRLADQLERRAFTDLERTVEAVMSIAPDDPEAAVARALLDRQAGIGEILHVDGPSLVVGAAFTADGRGFIALCNGIVSNDPVKRLATLVVGDASPSASPRVLRLDIRQALGVSFSPDRRSVFVGAIDGMFQFDVQTGRRLGRWETGWVDDLAVLSDGRRVLATARPGLALWDLELGVATRRFEGQPGTVRRLSASSDGRWAVSSSEDEGGGVVYLWDIRQNRSVWNVAGGAFNARGMAISTATNQVLIAAPGGFRLLDLTTGREIRRFADCPGSRVAVSPDGRWALAGGSQDDVVRLWDLADGRRVRTYPVQPGSWIGAVSFSPDGRQALASAYHRVHVWALPTRP